MVLVFLEMQLKYAISMFFTYFHFFPLPPKVSFAAHIAGGFAGMSIGYTVFSCFDKALLKDPRFWIAIAAYSACVLFAVFFNIFLSPANWPASSLSQIMKRAIWEKKNWSLRRDREVLANANNFIKRSKHDSSHQLQRLFTKESGLGKGLLNAEGGKRKREKGRDRKSRGWLFPDMRCALYVSSKRDLVSLEDVL